jgi:hypothetical protein
MMSMRDSGSRGIDDFGGFEDVFASEPVFTAFDRGFHN